jgi:hypothetical protein
MSSSRPKSIDNPKPRPPNANSANPDRHSRRCVAASPKSSADAGLVQRFPSASSDESSLTYWRRRVVEACVFGVDLNPMAVELAKLALWLDTVSVGHPLSFLDLHLLPGNSLIGARLAELGSLPDAPPIIENRFGAEFRERLPVITRALLDIQQMPSDTAAQVKEKDRLLRTHFRPFLVDCT